MMIESAVGRFVLVLCILSTTIRAQDINNDVEIIAGKEMPVPNNVIGLASNGYYEPHVSGRLC